MFSKKMRIEYFHVEFFNIFNTWMYKLAQSVQEKKKRSKKAKLGMGDQNPVEALVLVMARSTSCF